MGKSIEIGDIYQEYNDKMVRYITGMTYNKYIAEDLVQDSWIKIMNNIETYRTGNSIGSWIQTIMRNTTIDYLRKNNPIISREIVDIPIIDEHIVDLELLEEEELLITNIKTEVQNLSPKYQEVFKLITENGFKHREVSEYLGISVGTSKSNYAKAKQKLNKCLKKDTR